MSDPFEEYDDSEDVTLDPANRAPSNKVDRFKGSTGRKYRVALMYFHTLESTIISAAKKSAKKGNIEINKEEVKGQIRKALVKRAEELGKSVDELLPWQKLDLTQVQFKKVKTQFGKQEGVGLLVSRMGKDGAEADKVWGKLGDPSDYYFTVILVYPTDASGTVDVKAVLRESVVKPWRFAGTVFNRLIDINQNVGQVAEGLTLVSQDLTLHCKNEKFQNFEIDFGGKALWTRNDKIRDKFLPMAFALYEKMVGAREMSTADLREKLGEGGGDSGEDVTEDEEMNNLLDNV